MSREGTEQTSYTREEVDRLIEETRRDVLSKLPRAAAPVDETPKPEQTQELPRVTRSQLDEMVEEGKVSRAVADAYYEQQLRRDAAAEAVEKMRGEQRLRKVSDELDLYRESHPEVLEEGSETRARVRREYHELVGLGQPENEVTQLLALRNVLGAPGKVREHTREAREAHESRTGSGGSAGGPERKASEKDPAKGLPERFRKYVEKRIETGHFKGWDDDRVKKYIERAKGTVASSVFGNISGEAA